MVVKIEIPTGSKIKYEQNKDDVLVVNRVNSMHCPTNYGFVVNTLSGDGDPTDAFVVSGEALQPMVILDFEPLFLIHMFDNEEEDNKYVGRIKGDNIDVESQLEQILDYLNNYKTGVEIMGITLV